MTIIYRNALNRPLTNAELDSNFEYLNTEVEARYKIEDFTAAKISLQLNTPAPGQDPQSLVETNALDAWLVRGSEASSTLPESADKSSVLLRNSVGDTYARYFVGDLRGRADIATEADHAASAAALDLEYTVPVLQGGTSARNRDDARINLRTLGTEGFDPMIGTLTLATSDLGLPSLRFGEGNDVELSSANNGDMWFSYIPESEVPGHVAGYYLRYRSENRLETVAKLHSPSFTGVPKAPYFQTSSQIGTIDHINDAINSLFSDPSERGNHFLDLKSNTNSPTFTGEPRSVKFNNFSDDSDLISTNYFTQNVATIKSDAAREAAKQYSDSRLDTRVKSLFNNPAQEGSHKLDLKANSASPSLTGSPTADTPSTSDNSRRISTTAYTRAYVSNVLTSYYDKNQIDGFQDKWGSSRKYVQSSAPSGASNGDFWFKV